MSGRGFRLAPISVVLTVNVDASKRTNHRAIGNGKGWLDFGPSAFRQREGKADI
jgi:hypothetical protein